MSVPYLPGDFVVIQQMCIMLFKQTRERPDQILRFSMASQGLGIHRSWALGVAKPSLAFETPGGSV